MTKKEKEKIAKELHTMIINCLPLSKEKFVIVLNAMRSIIDITNCDIEYTDISIKCKILSHTVKGKNCDYCINKFREPYEIQKLIM